MVETAPHTTDSSAPQPADRGLAVDADRIDVTGPRIEQIFNLHGYQREAIESASRFTWNNWSRQTGKSFAFTLRRIIRGIARGRNQLFLSASEAQSRELMLKAGEHLDALKRGFNLAERSELLDGVRMTRREIKIKDGIQIIGLPANPKTARGFTGDVLLDEFAMHQNGDDIYAAAFPSVTRNRGELDVCSTPMGRDVFYRLASNDVFDHTTVTIEDAVAAGLDADINELRAGIYDQQRWRQEYLCEFLDDASAFLTFSLIATCEDPTLTRELDIGALQDHEGDVYVGMDIGRQRNPTVIWAFDQVGSTLRHLGIIEMAGERFREQYAVLSSVLRCDCVRRCCIDSTGLGSQMGEEADEDFSGRVECIVFTPAVKEQLAGDLLIALQDQSAKIPVCNRIRNDLHSIRRTVTVAGNVRYQAPQTGDEHADRFWALALAVHAAARAVGKPEAVFGPPLRCSGIGGTDSETGEQCAW